MSASSKMRWRRYASLVLFSLVTLISSAWGFDSMPRGCTRLQQRTRAVDGFASKAFPREFQLQRHRLILLMTNDDEKESKGGDADSKTKNHILKRFTSPIIDDPGLPLPDVLVAQVIAPSVQIAWLILLHAPQPTWLKPIFDSSVLYTRQGSFVAPALIHGAALASCWIVGALAARAYERKNISPVKKRTANTNEPSDGLPVSKIEWDYSSVATAIFKSGAFATGLLILATQADLYFEYGQWVQVGTSEEIDFRLLVAIVELTNDVFFEAVTIAAWRLYLAFQTERMAQE
jgi:hypothetical protein